MESLTISTTTISNSGNSVPLMPSMSVPMSPVAKLPDGWVGKAEIAAHFRIGIRTVTSWMKNGILPYLKVGRAVRFNVQECDEALREFEVKRKATR